MPKKKKISSPYNVDGLSINDIMNIDLDTFNKLNERDLRIITSRLVSAGNKRIRSLEKHGIESPALQSLGTDRRFSVRLPKGTDVHQVVNKLRSEFASARDFLSMKTSTIRGYKSYITNIKQEIADSMGVDIKDVSGDVLSRAYAILHKMQETKGVPIGIRGNPESDSSLRSKHTRDYIISQLIQNGDISDATLIRKTQKDYEDFYETSETEIS